MIGFSSEIFRAWPRCSEHAGQTMITRETKQDGREEKRDIKY
ncbi:MAG: hypothetical protein V5B40_20515 [Candidatus Accumulibacter meliphilus]